MTASIADWKWLMKWAPQTMPKIVFRPSAPSRGKDAVASMVKLRSYISTHRGGRKLSALMRVRRSGPGLRHEKAHRERHDHDSEAGHECRANGVSDHRLERRENRSGNRRS